MNYFLKLVNKYSKDGGYMKELIFEYSSIVSSVMLLVFYTNEVIIIFEQKKYKLLHSFEVFKIYFSKWFNYFPLILIPFIFFIDIWFVGLIYSLIALSFFIYLRLCHKNIILNFWKTLRLYIVILIIETIFGTILMLNVKLVELTSLLIIVLNINLLFVFLCYWISWPAEKLYDKIINKEDK